MTGYGKGESKQNGGSISIELRSVNNRYFDCTVKLPRAFLFAEDTLKRQVQAAVTRGKVDVFVTIDTSGMESQARITVDESLADRYYQALTQLKERYALKEEVSLSLIARQPDVLKVEQPEDDEEAIQAELNAALEQALTEFNAMREREGQKLTEDILHRADTIEQLVEQIEQRSPQTVADYRARLEAKMAEVLSNTQLDESRILTEAALFADKIAVDEETVRLHSHLSQLREMLKQEGAVGRKLDFLIQEFNREANTIGSKCNDITVSKMVVDMKAEIEKIREQVQNLE